MPACKLLEYERVKNVLMAVTKDSVLPLTFEHGANLPDAEAALAGKLSKREFHEEERDPTEHQHDEVGEHESTCR